MWILKGFLFIFLGVFAVYIGAFMLMTAMVPKAVGIMFAEKHGAWMREHVFRLPPAGERDDN